VISVNVELCRIDFYLANRTADPLGVEGDRRWRGDENSCNIFNMGKLKIRPRFNVEFGSDYFEHCDKYSLICRLVSLIL